MTNALEYPATPDGARLESLIALGSEPDYGSIRGGGLFVPELVLGPGHLAAKDATRILAHLIAVAKVRTAPLHPAVAWNSLYFGYDSNLPGYDTAACGALNLPRVRAGERMNALPVGALIEFSSGAKVDHLEWAEVVYKEGRPKAAVVDGVVKPEYSGWAALPGDTGELENEADLQELLVLDFAPFGPLPANAASWLERVRKGGRLGYVDELGHIAIEAEYSPAVEARIDDVDYFCEWMVRNNAELLRRGELGSALDDPDDNDALSEAMANSLHSIDQLMDSCDELGSWGGYWYLRADFDRMVADPDSPGGLSDAQYIMSRLARVPSDKRVVYRPLHDYIVVVGEPLLIYEGYARTVTYVNTMIGDLLAKNAPDGVLAFQGEHIHLRLDDRWSFGGIWRAERLSEDSTCSLTDIDPTKPLGLGSLREEEDLHKPAVLDQDELVEVDTNVGAIKASGQPFFWSTALRAVHRTDQRLWIHPDAALVPGAANTVVLRLEHKGEIADDERVQRPRITPDGKWLTPVRFPLDFFDGIRLMCLAVPGGSVVWAATETLEPPEEIGDVTYPFEFERSIVDPTRPRRPEPRLADQALRAIDRHGEAGPDGSRWLATRDISRLVFGPEAAEVGEAAVKLALISVPDRAAEDSQGRWCHLRTRPGRSVRAPVGQIGGVFQGVSERLRKSFNDAAVRHRREHRVVLHLRRLSVSEVANDARRAAYEELRNRAPNRANLPPTLPDGYTYVVEHTRGRAYV